MSSFVAVLPSIYPLWTTRCLSSCHFADDVIVVDNTVENRGVAKSWNLGIDAMEEQDADWLVIMSAALRFGAPGGEDFLALLDEPKDRVAVEAGHGIGWHLIAFPRRTIERVGRFDEVYFAYMEDIDYSRRCHLALGLDPPYWDKVSVDVAIAGFAHGIDLGGAKVRGRQMADLYALKWGGPKGAEKFKVPYNDPTVDLTHITRR